MQPSDAVSVCEDYKRIAGSGVYLKSLVPAPYPYFFSLAVLILFFLDGLGVGSDS
jgi:hypothetical protein